MIEAAPSPNQPPPRVLIVEDVALNRDLLEQLLEDAYDLRCAADGEAGLAQARAWRPHVILLDLSLPKRDGWSVARAIRKDGELAGTRIIALTAHALSGERDRAIAAGCDAYLTKPLDETALFDVVRRAAETAW